MTTQKNIEVQIEYQAALPDGCCPHCHFWVLNPALIPAEEQTGIEPTEEPEHG